MQETFDKAYSELNTAQKQAVDSIDGPLLVVAGPGTGKTELLSVRVANILLKTDTDPSSILCLTFTNKAATNLRDRLQKLIGPAAHSVVVRTFHSLAADIMNQYPDYFWSGARLSVAPDAVQLEIIESLLAKLPLDNPLSTTFAGRFTALGDVQQALRLAKEAGLTPQELRDIIKANLSYISKLEAPLVDLLTPTLNTKRLGALRSGVAKLPKQPLDKAKLLLPLNQIIKESLDFAIEQDLPTNKTTQTGRWKQRWLQTVNGQKGLHREHRRNEWWLAVCDVYASYRENLHVRGYYDYSDMLIEVIEQLDKQPEMRADIQERFLYVLIDEFQDTNSAQLRLAHQVADHYAANNRPNLMAVGDDDQSIFAFNGAELSNMLDFQNSYPEAKVIVLTDNYRSSQDILDTAAGIIEQAEDRLVKRTPNLSKKLIARTKSKDKSQISHWSYPTAQHQYAALADYVKKAWNDSGGSSSLAVLARKHDSLKQLAQALHDREVPISYEQQSNVIEHEAIKQVYLIASLVMSITKGDKVAVNNDLAELVRHPMWDISPASLWKLALANYSQPDWLEALLSHQDNRLNDIANWLLWLSRNSSDFPLPLILEYILGLRDDAPYLESPIKSYFIDRRELSSTYLEGLSAIEILRNLTHEFAGQGARLKDFVRLVRLHLDTNRVIADQSWFNSGHRAVELLTVHKAKGLEFDNVIIIDLIEGNWSPRVGGRAAPANLRLQAYGEVYDDYVRLLYVAATRARSNLIMTSYSTDSRGQAILASPLVAPLPLEEIPPPKSSVSVLETNLHWPHLATKDMANLLRERLENYSLSPTAFIDFLNVAEAGPDSFLERHLLRLPKAHSPKGSYGTAIHGALETAQRLVNTSKLEVGTVLDRFEADLSEAHLSPLESEQLAVQGRALLKQIIKRPELGLVKGGLAEQKLADITLSTARIGGKIDRLNIDGYAAIITDYKTGKALASFETKNQTLMVKAWRHRTQLEFYALLLKKAGRFKSLNNIRAQMLYVEAEAAKVMKLELEPTRDELDRLERLIEAVWGHIINLDFPDISEYSKDIAGIQSFENHLLNI